MLVSVDIYHDDTAEIVVKHARSEEERAQLAAEAAVLRSLAHPGVVRLVDVDGGDPPDGLLLRRIPGGDLSQLGAQPPEVVAGLGAAIATTVADLHDLGVHHGALEASHVLLDGEEAHPCSFGRARSNTPHRQAALTETRTCCALARLLLSLLALEAPGRLDRTRRRAAGARGRGRQRRRSLARQLTTCIPEARLPGGPDLVVETVSSHPGGAARTWSQRDRSGPESGVAMPRPLNGAGRLRRGGHGHVCRDVAVSVGPRAEPGVSGGGCRMQAGAGPGRGS